jgi:hypothetical protein
MKAYLEAESKWENIEKPNTKKSSKWLA